MQPVPRSQAEIERLFVEGYERLRRACHLYDAAHLSEAPDIAKEVANFVHDHGASSVSVLTAMGAKGSIQFEDSAQVSPEIPDGGTLVTNEYLLMHAQIGFSGMGYVPFLANQAPYKTVPFADWWSGAVLTRYEHRLPDKREKISRGELVMHLRHKEGGAHVDLRHFPSAGGSADKMRRLLEGEYVDGYMHLGDGPAITAEDHAPAYATMRQIGYEVVSTLETFRPDLTARANLSPTPGPRMKLGTR